METEDSYDPYEHREVEKPNNAFETCVHFLRATIGTGILVLPYGMKTVGWLCGAILLFLATLICLHVMHVIFRCEYIVCKRLKVPFVTYKECFKYAIDNGPPGMRKMSSCLSWSVDIFIISFQTGVLSVYIIFVSENILKLWNHFMPDLSTKLPIFIAILFIFFVVILFVPDLKVLSYFGLIANIAMLISIAAIFYYFCQNLPNLFKERQAFVTFTAFPGFIGTATFATMAIAAFLTLEEKIKNPRTFVKPFGVLNVCMILTFVIYLLFSLFAYWQYGEETGGNITLNIPPWEPLGITIIVTMAFAIYVSYGLQGFVTFHILWFTYIKAILEKKKVSNNLTKLYEYLVRFGFTFVAVILAISVPFIGILVGFIGAVAMGSVGFIFPPLMEISLLYAEDDYGKLKWRLVKDILVVIFGVILVITGVTATVFDIIQQYK